jgi:hypothetical protein
LKRAKKIISWGRVIKKTARFPNTIELERFHIFDAAPGQVGGFLAGESGKIVFIDQADLCPKSAAADTAPLIPSPMNEDVEMMILQFFDILCLSFIFIPLICLIVTA